MSGISSRKVLSFLVPLAILVLLVAVLLYRTGTGFGLGGPDSSAPSITEENTVHFSEAPNSIGEDLWVRGDIDHVFLSDNGNYFLNFCSDFRECPFSAVIFSEYAEGVGDTSSWSGREVHVYGSVGTYEGRAQIVIEDLDRIVFKEDSLDVYIEEDGASCSGRLVRVVNVIDGDTVWVEIDGETESVRLIGIDAPEIDGPYSDEECYGPEAAEYLSGLLEGESVVMKGDSSTSDRDVYDRLLRYVYMPDGELLNLIMVREGYASVYRRDFSKRDQFLDAEEKAKSEGLGLWGACIR